MVIFHLPYFTIYSLKIVILPKGPIKSSQIPMVSPWLLVNLPILDAALTGK